MRTRANYVCRQSRVGWKSGIARVHRYRTSGKGCSFQTSWRRCLSVQQTVRDKQESLTIQALNITHSKPQLLLILSNVFILIFRLSVNTRCFWNPTTNFFCVNSARTGEVHLKYNTKLILPICKPVSSVTNHSSIIILHSRDAGIFLTYKKSLSRGVPFFITWNKLQAHVLHPFSKPN